MHETVEMPTTDDASSWNIVVLQPISGTIFPSQFKFDGNFILLSSQLLWNDRYEIFHMARQLCCHGLYKIFVSIWYPTTELH